MSSASLPGLSGMDQTSTTLTSRFRVVEEEQQPYVAVTGEVTMDTIPALADRFGEVFGWLAGQGVETVGPPFFRYRVIDMDRRLVLEAGAPTATVLDGEGEVRPGVLPAGRYVTTTYLGHPADLVQVTGDLLAWAEAQGLAFDVRPGDEGEVWGARLEWMETDPDDEPDMSRWQTRLAFRLAG
ncbi:GyrI-like small molecule binding domain-containing protein [Friedmanniella luteola]|uniref:GyrI-like small molecule binding domain-containing protein n=1 Tax=Friedmanniella luteola TaxID=546871 RepID=A0A1H1N7M2_9ACTN|nr:GyrI-like domain-containing protein [Friedmanniella luteola]SDR95013.1 GyrI-like small molecule binding domain-containing protein [Friedmanniella luteola]